MNAHSESECVRGTTLSLQCNVESIEAGAEPSVVSVHAFKRRHYLNGLAAAIDEILSVVVVRFLVLERAVEVYTPWHVILKPDVHWRAQTFQLNLTMDRKPLDCIKVTINEDLKNNRIREISEALETIE